MRPASPTVASWELASRLRSRRRALGIDVATITRELGFTRNYWSAVENDRTTLAEEKLRAVARVLRFDGPEAEELLELRHLARERSWWNVDVVSPPLQQLYGLEFGASRIRTYEGSVVTGLLQTPAYAQALIGSSPVSRPIDVERLVALRIKRQERLLADQPLELSVVMSQASLLQHVGPPQVLLGQLRYLSRLVRDRGDAIELRVIPFARSHGGMVGASTLYIFDFDSPHLPTVAWSETSVVGSLTEEHQLVHHITLAYDQALESSLSRHDSLSLIDQCTDDLEREIADGR